MKRITIEGETRLITGCRYCPVGHQGSFGVYCWIDGRTAFIGERIPEWCPLEDEE